MENTLSILLQSVTAAFSGVILLVLQDIRARQRAMEKTLTEKVDRDECLRDSEKCESSLKNRIQETHHLLNDRINCLEQKFSEHSHTGLDENARLILGGPS